MIIYSLISLKHIQISHHVNTSCFANQLFQMLGAFTFHQQPEKCKTSNNNSHQQTTISDGLVPAA